MSTSSPWTSLLRRLKEYEKATSSLPEDAGIRASSNVHHLQRLLGAVEDAIDAELIRAREAGATWQGIGYGTSKQAAQQRHAKAARRLENAAALRRLRSGDRTALLP